jgi:hypothetical protein
MRDLKGSDRNKIVLADAVSGEELVVFYRTPPASVLKSYRQATVRRKGGKVLVDHFDPARKYGLEIITGIGEGCFGYDGIPISSDPASPAYREDWKDLLAATASDVVTAVARIAFDGISTKADEAGFAFEGETEDAVPLARS